MNETYEVSNLRVHSDMEQVRERSGMFIGDTDDPKQLFNEILDNSLDECQSGYCESIDILCDTKDRTYTIRDYGRGIPIGLMEKEDGTQKEALEVLSTKLFSGGKFDNNAYKISGGLHGVGLGCCNALSELFEITTRRDGKSVTLISERGNNYPVIYSDTVQPNGTTVSFKADEEIFDTSMISTEYIKSRCIIANAFGNKINLYIDGTKVDLPKDTVEELVEIPPEESEYSSTTIKVQLDSGEFMIAVLKYTSSTNSRIDGYTNLLPNRYGGTHVKLLDEAIETAWSEFYSEVNTPLKPSDCKVGLKALVAVFISNPSFNSQTKEKLTTKKKFIQPLMDKFSEEFKNYLIQNSELRLALLKRFEEYRISQNKLTSKKEIMDLVKLNEKVGLHGSTRRKSVVPGLADCTSSSIEGSEEFLVEGDSAGGGAKRARDKKTQAVLPLRGKIKNVAYMSLEDALKSEDVRKIVNSNGAGVGEDCDPERCRYERLNILCFTGDTRVKMLDGTYPTFKELADMERRNPGREYWVYSIDKEGNIVPGRAYRPEVKKSVTELVEVTLEDGSTVKCTPDHKFLTKEYGMVEAKDLYTGISLEPLYTSMDKHIRSEYESVWSNGQWVPTHHMVNGVPEKGYIVHHINRNKLDNTPLNLQKMTKREHLEEHSREQSELMKKLNNEGKMPSWTYTYNGSEKHISDIKKAWSDPEKASRMSKSLVDYNKSSEHRKYVSGMNKNPDMIRLQQRGKLSKKGKLILDELGDLTESIISDYSGITMDSILKYFDSFEDFVENSRNYNHKVLSVVHISLKEPVPVYCLTVENHHNFAICCEKGGDAQESATTTNVFVSNCDADP